MIKVICQNCKKEFSTYLSKIKIDRGKFCSRKCFRLSRRKKIIRKCSVCEKEFEIVQSIIKNGGGKFCSLKCKNKFQLGKNNGNWKGGKVKSIDNRWLIYKPEHPFANSGSYIFQSRLITEKCLERYLTRKEVIHHINGNTLDDNPENLYLFASNNKHIKFHNLKIKPKLVSNLP